MSRRPARYTEADLNRALKAAERRGPHWMVEVFPDGVIRLVRANIPAAANGDGEGFDPAPAIML